MADYTHLELNNEVRSISGMYIPKIEKRLNYKGREVFYVGGEANADSACCSGGGCWDYVLVPGYVVKWQHKKNQAGQLVSEIEPIRDQTVKNEIREIIDSTEPCAARIEFW